MKNVGIVFGVFDGLHEGHIYFLNKASTMCTQLIIVVTLSETVELLKNKTPNNSYEVRHKAIEQFNPSHTVISGDKELGMWSVFKNKEEFIVILGYDQHGIARELEKQGISFIYLDSHFPEKYKSSLLNAA